MAEARGSVAPRRGAHGRRELLCDGVAGAVRLGVISDTHGMLRPQVFEIFKEVDHILHGGDVGRSDLLVELRALAPVTAVYGNSDGLDVRSQLPQVAEVELDGFPIVVTHGDQFGSPNPAKLHEAFPDAEIIIFGHSHRPLLELVDKTVDRKSTRLNSSHLVISYAVFCLKQTRLH